MNSSDKKTEPTGAQEVFFLISCFMEKIQRRLLEGWVGKQIKAMISGADDKVRTVKRQNLTLEICFVSGYISAIDEKTITEEKIEVIHEGRRQNFSTNK